MRNNIRLFSFLALFGSLLGMLGGCKSSEKAGPAKEAAALSPKRLFEEIQARELPYHTFSARLNVDLIFPEKEMSSRVELKMVKDSAIWLSVQPFLGIEVFRAELTVDSVKILDRLNKRYVAENYERLRGQTPIEFNFYNLQALFTNRLFLPGRQTVTPKQYNRFKWKQEGSTTEIKAKDSMGLFYTFQADGEGKILSTDVSDPDDRYALDWTYADFRITGNRPFPVRMDVNILKNGQTEGGAKLYFSRIRTNEPVRIDFSIPSKYKRITFAQIIKAIGNSKK